MEQAGGVDKPDPMKEGASYLMQRSMVLLQTWVWWFSSEQFYMRNPVEQQCLHDTKLILS